MIKIGFKLFLRKSITKGCEKKWKLNDIHAFTQDEGMDGSQRMYSTNKANTAPIDKK